MNKKKEVMPELVAAFKRAKQRASEAKAASTQQDKLVQLEHELAWAYVVEVEDQVSASAEVIDKNKRKLQKIDDAVQKQKASKLHSHQFGTAR